MIQKNDSNNNMSTLEHKFTSIINHLRDITGQDFNNLPHNLYFNKLK